jgi:AmmeMemoRadiSam system protein B
VWVHLRHDSAALTRSRKRVFLLGPSHHAYLPGVALSRFKSYDTPLGDIPICSKSESAPVTCTGSRPADVEAVSELKETGIFSDMSPSVDEAEHSLEMHLPYLRHVCE